MSPTCHPLPPVSRTGGAEQEEVQSIVGSVPPVGAESKRGPGAGARQPDAESQPDFMLDIAAVEVFHHRGVGPPAPSRGRCVFAVNASSGPVKRAQQRGRRMEQEIAK